MKRSISLLLCLLMLASALLLPVSAAIFQVRFYEEEIYAGGVLDLYAIPRDGGVEPFTYQWQAKGYGWIDLEDNDVYKGTKTDHLRLYTKTGDYGDFGSIPFQCAVTDAEGTTFYTPEIYPEIYPTEKMLSNMEKWGYGLYEPTLTNVKNLKTSDDKNYTASAYSGAKIDLAIGSKSVSDKSILENSEVKLTREIHITEYGHTTKTTDKTTYIPYTIGSVKVEFKLNLKIGSTDLGTFDTKTVNITTTKPDAIARGVTKKECSMLRYPYNESETLGSLPQGAVVQVLGKDGGYYQVYVRSVISYIPEGLLRVDEPAEDTMIKNVDVTVDAPVAGERPSFTCKVKTTGCELYKTEPVTWLDKTTDKFLTSSDKFQAGHSYQLCIWVSAKDGYRFQTDSSGKPKLTGSINGNLPPYINKAYEQDPEEVVELTYDFNNVKEKEPEQVHTCAPVLVKQVEPTCTKAGHEAYYHCSCGMDYKDAQGKTAVNISTWGVLAATGHKPSDWRVTGAYHYKACTVCGDMLDQEDHTGGAASCSQQANCSVCGAAYGNFKEEHRWSPKYHPVDDTGHAYQCADCKGYDDIKPHKPGPAATEKEPQVCKECGYIITPALNHTHSLTKAEQVAATCTTDGVMEHYTCSGCSVLFADAQATQQIDSVSQLTLKALGHFADEWAYDTQRHWQSCRICGTVMDAVLEEHLDEDADGVCDTCCYTLGAEPSVEAPAQAPTAETPDAPAVELPPVDASEDNGSSWLKPVLVAIVCFGVGITAAVIILSKKKKEGAW